MIAAAIYTCIIECFTSIFFKIRKVSDYFIIIGVNLITNSSLNLLLGLVLTYLDSYSFILASVIILETLVVIVEYILYKKLLLTKVNYLFYSITCNLLSFAFGSTIVRIVRIVGSLI